MSKTLLRHTLIKQIFLTLFLTSLSYIVSEIGFDIESTEKCQTIKEVKQYKHIINDSSNYYKKNLILNK
jgi:hypothetical protein